eukprot:scaffold1785_cov247-Pinguiococcus_pyrenoidosus.AAC.1
MFGDLGHRNAEAFGDEAPQASKIARALQGFSSFISSQQHRQGDPLDAAAAAIRLVLSMGVLDHHEAATAGARLDETSRRRGQAFGRHGGGARGGSAAGSEARPGRGVDRAQRHWSRHRHPSSR